jgi:hypothetical protein
VPLNSLSNCEIISYESPLDDTEKKKIERKTKAPKQIDPKTPKKKKERKEEKKDKLSAKRACYYNGS